MRRRRRLRERQEMREKRRSIFEKLCAAFLRSFRGQHSGHGSRKTCYRLRSSKMKGLGLKYWLKHFVHLSICLLFSHQMVV